ncbi:hypothetical protein GCM10008932_14660 [Alkalibacterium iburiense]|uniref:Uncharacterized protein n=1 Tax=Alkalibacterium iburiense TaxID=290589 RepID=A0ABN0XG50_9LACT
MNHNKVEIDVVYKDNYIEVFTVDYKDMHDLLMALIDDQQKNFIIGNKTLFKKDLNGVGIANHGLGFNFF